METVDYHLVQVSYFITSHLGAMENSRYNQEINGKIELINEHGESIETIGYIQANKLLVELGLTDGWLSFEIYDVEAHILKIGEAIFEFSNDDWRSEMEEYYQGMFGRDILILSRLEIIPKYRGMDFGQYLIKDVYNNFIDGAALFVLKAFPIQFEASITESSSEFTKAMEYEKLERDFEKATCKLIAWYEKMGFEIIPSVSTEFMFINPFFANDKFDKIILE